MNKMGFTSFETQVQSEEYGPVLRPNIRRLKTGPCLVRGELKSDSRNNWEDICSRAQFCELAKKGDVFYNKCATNRYEYINCEHAIITTKDLGEN